MPLRSGEKPAYGFLTSSVSFYMVDDNGTRVRCSISDRALNQFVPMWSAPSKDCLRRFGRTGKRSEHLLSGNTIGDNSPMTARQ